MNSKKENFLKLGKLLQKHGKNLSLTKKVIDSKAKDNKPQLLLYGKKSVSIYNRKPQPTYVAGVIEQKHFVGFYMMPIYSHQKVEGEIKNPDLKKALKGKSCFNITKLDSAMLKELDCLLASGIKTYRKEEWI
jgi:hypothetical protein